MPDPADHRAADLKLMCRLAELADAVSLPRFGAGDLRVDAKPDMTPVTDADLAVERALRDALATSRPDDAVLGEEFGGSTAAAAGSGRCWVIDPIDGTKNFVRGVPVWATLIALLEGGRPVAGMVSAPALARRWWGAMGGGARTSFLAGTERASERACRVSAVSDVADASLSLSEIREWDDAGLGEQLRALAGRCWRVRGYGDFYSYMLLAEGAVDIAAEPELSLWDLAGPAAVVTAAGGTFTQLDGGPTGPASTSAVATNGPLHAAVVQALARPEMRPIGQG